jgi:prepilin-type processing-associated H-X9-DG protein
LGSGCSSGVNPVGAIGRPFSTSWVNKPNYGHGDNGNAALLDGSVQKTTRRDINLLLEKGDDNGSIHMQYPRPPDV